MGPFRSFRCFQPISVELTRVYRTPNKCTNTTRQGKDVVKNMMVTANKATVDVIMPSANEK